MCKAQEEECKEKAKEASSSPGMTTMDEISSTKSKSEPKPNSETLQQEQEEETIEAYVRRGKRVKQDSLPLEQIDTHTTAPTKKISRVKSSLSKKHAEDGKSGGIESLLPSIGIVVVLGFAIVAKMGWRGRASVAGIDLGTTNSVICVQQQSDGKGEGYGVGHIECIPDPYNNSPIIPSIVSFQDPHNIYVKKDKKYSGETGDNLNPHPAFVTVGAAAKPRIDSHPHHTVYHAKRVLGSSFDDQAIQELLNEVEFEIVKNSTSSAPAFRVPFHNKDTKNGQSTESMSIPPFQVGSYVVNHLIQITRDFLGHDNVQSAVIAVPAEFNPNQIQDTILAFRGAGIKVTRILKEPEAAALAYGLQKKSNVEYILVYDFGGGTLDVSLLQVFEGGYIEVIGNDGDNRLGGADFDAIVAHSLLESEVTKMGVAGEVIVERISNATREIGEALKKTSQNKKDATGDYEDVEELLSSTCERLQEMPLCTISSFHTMGENMKIQLSSMNESTDEVQARCFGLPQLEDDISTKPQSISDLCSLLEPVTLSMSLENYNVACKPLFIRSLKPIRRLLDDLDMQPGEIDEVVMVGGTTRMPQVREMVQKELEVESLNTSIDPDLTVAYGAASVID
mmetsp:Transcript_5970/g.8781  ORF Transcript_5970/g.8781 Transcript_5970/m.8781 type:complete len:622 (-) Transcript_5970:88-1953(-)